LHDTARFLTLIADGSVGPESGLLIVRALVLGQDGAGNVETRDHVLLGKFEAEALGVVVDVLDLGELQGDEALVASSEGLLRLDAGGGGDLVSGRRAGEEVVASAGNTDTASDDEWEA
jgi:hypothetical protein